MKMKNRIWSYQLLILLLLLTSTNSCKEDDAIAPTGTVTDIDGNVYNTVTIGTQTWMAENLKTTKYNDGTNIPNVTYAATWAGLTSPGYCWSENNIANKTTYGALYNWYTVNTGKLAPTGWHVPTHEEFTTLETYLGGDEVAGGKLKEIGFTHWNDPNTGATNETGFTALPGGFCDANGFFGRPGYYGDWWSSTESPSNSALSISLTYGHGYVKVYSVYRRRGHSVRCLKD
jgi:uncharacterized protein (TIGR02145 family)